MTIDEKTLIQARKLAMEKHTTITALIRKYLKTLIAREELQKEEVIKKLDTCFNNKRVRIGPRNWRREDLYGD